MVDKFNFKPLITAGTFLGLGMGGFVDGILFHQILQLHSMLSNRIFPDTLVHIEVNMFWDGLFHGCTWTMTMIGLSLLWNAMGRNDFPRSTKTLVGSMLFGWGIFHIVEGIIDHHILQLHHVVQRASQPQQMLYDFVFLAFGLVLIFVGRMLIKRGRD